MGCSHTRAQGGQVHRRLTSADELSLELGRSRQKLNYIARNPAGYHPAHKLKTCWRRIANLRPTDVPTSFQLVSEGARSDEPFL